MSSMMFKKCEPCLTGATTQGRQLPESHSIPVRAGADPGFYEGVGLTLILYLLSRGSGVVAPQMLWGVQFCLVLKSNIMHDYNA